MNFRNEWKHEISYGDMIALRQKFSAVMQIDSHAINGKYFIRSLYFDNLSDKALREKIDGVNIREKFRIRLYNNDKSVIKLEKKSKINGLCSKESVLISPTQANLLVNSNYSWMVTSDIPLINEFYSKIMSQGLAPKTIVDYERIPFFYAPGNVRVTLDYNIRTGIKCTDFLNPNCVTVPTDDAIIILEVKWDTFLPDLIRDAIQLPSCRSSAFSKYAVCRIYG